MLSLLFFTLKDDLILQVRRLGNDKEAQQVAAKIRGLEKSDNHSSKEIIMASVYVCILDDILLNPELQEKKRRMRTKRETHVAQRQ